MASRKIAISLDSSPVSQEAFTWAAKHIVRNGDQVHLVTVIQPAIKAELAYGAGGRAPLVDRGECAVDPADLARAQQLLEKCKEELLREGVAEGQITTQPLLACIGTSQDIGHHIVDYTVQQGCSSLVVGSRGMGETRRKMMGLLGLGSVSDYITKHAPCNVLVHKSRPAS